MVEVHRQNVFAIWDKGQELLQTFMQQINDFHPSIKFTAETSTDRVAFLDTTVILEGNKLHTDLYTKPTDTHQYLSPQSCHPRHCTSSIPYSQSLRIKRICSREEDYRSRPEELKSYLLARGYKELTRSKTPHVYNDKQPCSHETETSARPSPIGHHVPFRAPEPSQDCEETCTDPPQLP